MQSTTKRSISHNSQFKKIRSQQTINQNKLKASDLLNYEKKIYSNTPKFSMIPRSTDLKFESIEKQMDFSRLVSSQFKVNFYQSYTNRKETPNRIYRNNQIKQNRSLVDQHLRTNDSLKQIYNENNYITPKVKQIILGQQQHQMLPPLPKTSCSPRIRTFKPLLSKYTINDYHSMETNRSYGRNHIGGFYFH